jgi:mRNA interferase RelE/StbE
MAPPPKSVKLADGASKAIATADPPLKETLKEAIREIANSPLIGKALKGQLKGLRSYRVGKYRITYSFTESSLEVASIKHRKDAYR